MYPEAVQNAIDELGRLPGIGPKSAQRLAFYLLECDLDQVERLAASLQEMRSRVRFCDRCFNIAEEQFCNICTDSRRKDSVLCVVEEPRDLVALERTASFRGRYHVLGGSINPIQGIGPEQLRIRELLSRLDLENVAEIIIATNPNIEGDATAMYLARLLEPLGVEVTKLASGLPVGGDLEYADELTLGRALEGRRRLIENDVR